MDPQLRLIYATKFSSSFKSLMNKPSRVLINDINIMRMVEDALLLTGLDIGEVPDSYNIYQRETSLPGAKDKYIIYYKDNKPIKSIIQAKSKNINMLKFFSNKQADAIMENINLKSKRKNIRFESIIYFAKKFDVEIKNINQIITLIIITGFEEYDWSNMLKIYKTICGVLDNGHFSGNPYDFTDEIRKGDCFVTKSDEVFNDIINLRKKYNK